MSNDKFSRQQYTRQQEAFARIRNKGLALRSAKQAVNDWCDWDPTKNGEERDIISEGGGYVVRGVVDYMDQYCTGSLGGIIESHIHTSYNVFGDLKRNALLGQPTQAFNYKFEWERFKIVGETYTGDNELPVVSQDLHTVIATQARDRNTISKATTWDRQACTAMGPDDVNLFITLARVVSSGGNHFTRILKGMLIYFDLLETGTQEFSVDRIQTIDYTPQAVLGSYRASGRSYAYASQSSSQEYLTTLMLVGQEYPNRYMQSTRDITVPEDGDHYLVVPGGGASVSSHFRCRLSARAVMSGLVKYSAEIGVPHLLEKTMILASSMRENRYLRVVGLPAVSSISDLLVPGMTYNPMNHCPRPHSDLKTMTAVGRIHQMAMFLAIKDVVMSARLSSSGADYRTIARQYLTSNDNFMLKMQDNITALRLLRCVPELKWVHMLDEEDFDDVDDFCILEGLWLADEGIRSMRDGGVHVFKDAHKDTFDENPYIEIMRQELAKGQIVYDPRDLPDGDFTVMGRFIGNALPETVFREPELYIQVDWVDGEIKNKERRTKNLRNRRAKMGEEPAAMSPLRESYEHEYIPEKSVRGHGRSSSSNSSRTPSLGSQKELRSFALSPERYIKPRRPTRESPPKRVLFEEDSEGESVIEQEKSNIGNKSDIEHRIPEVTGLVTQEVEPVNVPWKPRVAPRSEVIPKDIQYGDKRTKEEGAKRDKIVDEQDDRISASMEMRSEVKRRQKSGRVFEARKETIEQLRELGIDHDTLVLGRTAAEIFEILADKTLEYKMCVLKRGLGMSVGIERITDMDLIVESLQYKGDLMSHWREGSSGSNRLFRTEDSRLLNMMLVEQGRTGRKGLRWVIPKTLVANMVGEYQFRDSERAKLLS